jgi:hypothetical protein
MLLSGVIIGTIIKVVPVKKIIYKSALLAGVIAVSVFGVFFFTNYFGVNLETISYFQAVSNTLQGTFIANLFGGSAPLATEIVLILLFEASLTVSFAVEEAVDQYVEKRKQKTGQPLSPVKAENQLEPSKNEAVEVAFVTPAIQEETVAAEEQVLHKDEQSIMELFLYEKITQITPNLNALQPEGYSYEGLPQLDWDIKRTRETLDALVRKGFLKTELVDKVITCTACGSANVRIKKLCPECNSLRLRKEALIEHVSCGTVDRQTVFEKANGELVCPKCNVKLQTAGEDYKILPPSYVCLNCNVRSNEPLVVAKCDNCGTTAELDEEPEVYLYKYTVNSEMPLKEMQQIKPIEVCAKFFRALGYKVVAPAYVNGKSGTKHLFDMLVLGKVGLVELSNSAPSKTVVAPACKNHDNTVIELLISSKRVDLEEITRIYGMINDVDCEALIFVIPSMTENARNYAAAYNMKVCEGKTIEEALVNWVIPKTGENKKAV